MQCTSAAQCQALFTFPPAFFRMTLLLGSGCWDENCPRQCHKIPVAWWARKVKCAIWCDMLIKVFFSMASMMPRDIVALQYYGTVRKRRMMYSIMIGVCNFAWLKTSCIAIWRTRTRGLTVTTGWDKNGSAKLELIIGISLGTISN